MCEEWFIFNCYVSHGCCLTVHKNESYIAEDVKSYLLKFSVT